MKVISFYTNEFYLLQARAMKASAEAVGLQPVYLYRRAPADTWWQGCNYKARLVLEAIESFGSEPVLFLDADTRVRSYPKLLDTLPPQADFASHFFNPGGPSGGVIWFNGRRALPLVKEWVRRVELYPQKDDDNINFRNALKETKPRIYLLPPAYNWAEKIMRQSYPSVVPVIEHLMEGEHLYPVPVEEA